MFLQICSNDVEEGNPYFIEEDQTFQVVSVISTPDPPDYMQQTSESLNEPPNYDDLFPERVRRQNLENLSNRLLQQSLHLNK